MTQDTFTQTYLKSLNMTGVVAEQSKDQDCKDGECKDCTNEGKKQDEVKECNKTNNTNPKDVITDDADEEEKADEADDSEEEAPAEDDEKDEQGGDEQADGEEDQESSTCFCFKTTNQTLIDAINSGFDKVVFTVKAKDDEGNDTTTDVEFTAEDFADFEECDEVEDEGEEDEVSDDDFADFGNDDGEGTDEAELSDDGEFSDEEDTSFESVFKKYYGALVGEAKK